jgi:hypothetical protein
MNCSKANLRLRVLFRNVIIHKFGGELIDYLVATLYISHQSTLVRSLVLVYRHDGSTIVDAPITSSMLQLLEMLSRPSSVLRSQIVCSRRSFQ